MYRFSLKFKQLSPLNDCQTQTKWGSSLKYSTVVNIPMGLRGKIFAFKLTGMKMQGVLDVLTHLLASGIITAQSHTILNVESLKSRSVPFQYCRHLLSFLTVLHIVYLERHTTLLNSPPIPWQFKIKKQTFCKSLSTLGDLSVDYKPSKAIKWSNFYHSNNKI